MLDLKLVREQPDVIRDTLKRRGDKFSIDTLLARERERRDLIADIEARRREHKQSSDVFARRKGGVSQAQLKKFSDDIKKQEHRLREVEHELDKELALLPNIPHESVPVGNASSNKLIRTEGEKPSYDFTPTSHLEIAERLGLIDFARGAKVAGSHFPLYTGQGARLERALITWMLDIHTKEHGYMEILPPFLANRESMFSTGHVPKFEEDMYRLRDDDLFLVPTAEVPLTNFHRNEMLEEKKLPSKYAAYTACFRREAGSYGKETRGLIRVHQFDKIELVKFTTPETSYDELEALVRDAEVILKRLGLHYRVICLATEDLGFAAAKCYDIEAWAPGLNQFLEVSSCSNFEAFQARRANIRYRQVAAKKAVYVHTLNGSGVALARTLISLLETHQTQDGHVRIPEVLRPYLDGAELL